MQGGAAASSLPAAKRPKLDAAAAPTAPAARPLMHPSLAAMGGARPPLHPAMQMAPQLTAQQAAAAAQMRLQQSLTVKRAQFPPIVSPATDEDRQLVPRPRLQVTGLEGVHCLALAVDGWLWGRRPACAIAPVPAAPLPARPSACSPTARPLTRPPASSPLRSDGRRRW